jgi:Zn-dependent protease
MFGDLTVTTLVIIIASILLSLTLHEAMHAYAAHALGDTTAKDEGRLTLNPLQHIDMLMTIALPVVLILLGLPPILIAKPVPFDPRSVRFGEYGSALMALAGPFTNLGLAVLASIILRFMGAGGIVAEALLIFMQINIVFFVFNMIPFPPLDGSRLLYAVAPEPVQRVMYRIESAGLAVTLLVFLLLARWILPFVGNTSEAIFTFLLR